MNDHEIKKAIECIESNIKSIKEGFGHLKDIEADPDWNELNSGILQMITGVHTKISRAINTIRITDDSSLSRLDGEVRELGLKKFCEAFGKSISPSYPRNKKITAETRLEWNKWKDKIEHWLESIESAIEALSEIAEGSAMQGVLKLLSKAITALAKAISSTKGS